MLDYLGDRRVHATPRSPPKSASTLDGFLFDAKQGYCQQYSGAMALLLRMAGIPARVVTGFSTGATDIKTGEYVVRDFDAHSWVEAYYPGWGWLTFDPTPADSPARSQPADARSIAGRAAAASSAELRRRPARPSAAAASRSTAEPAPWWRIPAIVAGALALIGARAARACAAGARGAPPALSELERALRRTRREPAPGTTLHALELRFAARPPPPATCARCARAATATRRATRRARSAAACGPSSDAEAGLLGRIRAWWALPPQVAAGLQLVAMDDVYDLYQRGMALLEDGHFHQATIPLAKARDLEPDKTSIREALGRAYFRSGGFEEARAEFEAVVERAPDQRLRALLPRAAR